MPEEKTIGEILKEEGLIKEENVEVGGSEREEVDIRKVIVEVEKLKAVVDTLKTTKFEADERIKDLAEEIGEIRSLFFQRDASIREMETKLEKIEETVEEIKPDKIKKLIGAKDKEIDEIIARVEKVEEILKDLSQRIIKAEKILEGIRSIENLEKIDKEIEERLNKIEELKSAVERDAAKSERFYLESEKRLKEISSMKTKLDKIDELTKELVRSIDEIKIKLDAYITKEDFKEIIKEELGVGSRKEEKLAEMEEKKRETVNLLKNLDDQYKKGMISESAYKEIKEKNEAILENIEKEIKRLQTEEEPKNLSEWLDYFEKKIEDLLITINSDEKKIRSLEEEIKKISGGLKEVKPEIKISPEALSLQKEIEEIKEFLAILEDQYRKGIISEKAYKEARERNLEKLEKMYASGKLIDEKIEKLTEKINELETFIRQEKSKRTKLNEIDERLEILKKKMDEMKRNIPLIIE